MEKWIQKQQIDVSRLFKNKNLSNYPDVFNLPDGAIQVLMQRGYDTPEKIHSLLSPDVNNLHNTRTMKDAEKAASLIIESIQNNEEIVVYGDYDCDGISAVSTMMILLRKAGANVSFWTNNRFIHGYGINRQGVDDMLNKFPHTKLIVTVDNGISAHEGISYAQELGMKVIVTDHHDVGDVLPSAEAVVNPKRIDCEYPFKGLCGAGVAYKLMLLLYEEMGFSLKEVHKTLDIVALGTVADIVPLIDENRIIVQIGVELMKRGIRSSFSLLQQITNQEDITAHYTLGYRYGPMMNACCRITGDPTAAIELFLTDDVKKMKEIIRNLMFLNEIRKELTEEQMEIAKEQIKENEPHIMNVIVNDSFHEGVIGLIAGRLKEEYYRPFFVLTKVGDVLKGSGRGIEGIHLKKALDEVSDLLLSYGGHEKACGLSLPEMHLDEFISRITKIAEMQLTESHLQRIIEVEIPLSELEINFSLIDGLKKLEPFGEGFPKPVVGIKHFNVERFMTMGNEGQHLKLKGSAFDVIMWNGVKTYQNLREPVAVKIIGHPSVNEWKGKKYLQFIVESERMRPIA